MSESLLDDARSGQNQASWARSPTVGPRFPPR